MGLLTNYKKSEVLVKKEIFNSKFNYSEFHLNDKESLIELEKKATHTGNLLKENLKDFGEIFLEAHKIFSNNKNGTFGKWYELLGFKKDFVYLCLDRRELSLEYNSNEVYRLPDRVIKDIKKIEKKSDVIEILQSKNPKEKLKELKENYKVISAETIKISKKLEIKEKLNNISKAISSKNFDNKKLIKIEKILFKLENELL
ncbi:hypothetical protein [Cetobacterium sp.]|uniref:hypothetical protein n=1 Tax=Cetobacterium sp. TaxID=2071632 RepID=UPI003F3ED483